MFKKVGNLIWQVYCWQPFRQFVKYGVVGSTTVIIDMVIIFVFTEYFGLWYMFSAVISQTVAMAFNFLMNRNWSFGSTGMMRGQMVKYLLLSGFNYLYQLGALWLLVEALHLHYLLAKVFIAMFMVTWNFLMFKYVVYK
jgi:putative flippase GtrA